MSTSSGDEWELVEANEVHTIDVLKQEGNIQFQNERYLDAIQVYAHALNQMPPSLDRLSPGDRDTLSSLEVAIRLNRALAYIQLHDNKLVLYAEEDCSLVLMKEPECVKAYYRRALAREQLGNIKGALIDAERMYELEPANPAGHQLLARLRETWCNRKPPSPTVAEGELTKALQQQCAIARSDRPAQKPKPTVAMGSPALDAWKSLQDEEIQLRQVYGKSSKTKPNKAVNRQMKKPMREPPARYCREVSTKTDSIWATLVQEEESTVHGVYKKRAEEAASKMKSVIIHPSRP